MSNDVIEVPPLSRGDIRRYADLIRNLAFRELGISSAYFPIVDIVERLLPRIDPDFHLEILEAEEMGDVHGLTVPSQHVIKLREDVYEGACNGGGRDRMTVGHELGHYILHDDLRFPRQMKASDLPAYQNAEWQANCFAAELLVPAKRACICGDASTIANLFGVSHESAAYQYRVLKKEGLIK
jgi:hypothetical protein